MPQVYSTLSKATVYRRVHVAALFGRLWKGDVGVVRHRADTKAVADLQHFADDRVGHQERIR